MQIFTRTGSGCRYLPALRINVRQRSLWPLRISEAQRGMYVKPVHASLSELWERYFAYARTHKRSWKRDEQMYGNLEAFLGGADLATITLLRVEEYQQHRVRQVSPATVNRETALLKHMFNMAERWEMYHGANPVRWVKFLPGKNLQFHTLSEDDERRLLESSPPYLREMILFALNIGLRTNEIFNLKWEDVDIEQRRLKMIVKKTQRAEPSAQRRGFRGRGVEAGDTAWAVCFLQPHDRRPVPRCKGCACRGSEAGRAGQGNVAHVPPYVRVPPHPKRSGYRDGERPARPRQYQHDSALRSFQR